MQVETHPNLPRIVCILGYLLIHLINGCNSPATAPGKVLVVNARGLAYQDLLRHLDTVEAQGFFHAKLKDKIQELVPITNAVTISNIASFETGTLPSAHGILGHTFALRKGDSLQAVSGFSQYFAVETFWERAAKAGKKVLNVGALILHGKYDPIENVDCLAQGQQLSNSNFAKLSPAPIQAIDSLQVYEIADTGPASSKNPYIVSMRAYVIRSQASEGELVLDEDLDLENGYIGRLKKGQWLEIEQTADQNRKTAFRLKYVGKQRDTINLYIRPTYQNRGYPENFLIDLDQSIGAAKGWPNTVAYTAGRLSSKTLVEEIYQEMDYLMAGVKKATQNKDYDLVLLDYPLMDRFGHAFRNELDSSKSIQQHYQAAFVRMDQDFSDLQHLAEDQDYELMVVSGHGFSPIHTSINPNQLMADVGLQTHPEASNWQAFATAGKVAAHIYLNPGLAEQDRNSIRHKIIAAFQDVRTPDTQVSFVEGIYEQDQLSAIGHNHPNAGDLFVLLKPGFVFQNGGKEVFSVPLFKGDHGFSPNHPSAKGVLLADSPCDPCHVTDVARIVLKALKLE